MAPALSAGQRCGGTADLYSLFLPPFFNIDPFHRCTVVNHRTRIDALTGPVLPKNVYQ